MFRILILYKSDEALDRYLSKFYALKFQNIDFVASKNRRSYCSNGMIIDCVRGISESTRGYKVDFIAVQEELTWRSDWKLILDNVLEPLRLSPIPIHIFDGISLAEATIRADGN